MASEVKIVILLKDGHGSVGIQSPECDPVFSTVEGDLVSIAAELPALVQLAEMKWSTNPKNPKAPEPPPPPAPTYSPSAPKSRKEEAAKAQPSWF